MSPLEHKNEERPQDNLRSSLREPVSRGGRGLELLLSDLCSLWPAIAAILIYGLITHLMFGRFCPMLILTNLPCPGCGMTRALFLVLRGKCAQAFRLQPLIYGWILLGAAFIVRRYLIRKKTAASEKKVWLLLLGLLLVGSILLYGYRIFHGFPSGLAGEGRSIWELLGSAAGT